MMVLPVSIGSPKQLEFTRSHDADDETTAYTERCYCNACTYLARKERRLQKTVFLGALVPLLWLWSLWVIVKSHTARRNDESSHDEWNQYHHDLQRRVDSIGGHTLCALAIYAILVCMVVYSIVVGTESAQR